MVLQRRLKCARVSRSAAGRHCAQARRSTDRPSAHKADARRKGEGFWGSPFQTKTSASSCIHSRRPDARSVSSSHVQPDRSPLEATDGRTHVIRQEARFACADMIAIRNAAIDGAGVALLPDHVCMGALRSQHAARQLPPNSVSAGPSARSRRAALKPKRLSPPWLRGPTRQAHPKPTSPCLAGVPRCPR